MGTVKETHRREITMKKVLTRIGTITASDEVLDWLSVLLEDAVRYNETRVCLM